MGEAGGAGGPSSAAGGPTPTDTVESCDALEAAVQASPAAGFIKEVTYDEILDQFLGDYGTIENWVRSYGGEVVFDQIDHSLHKSN